MGNGKGLKRVFIFFMAVAFVAAFFVIKDRTIFGEVFLYETMPYYILNNDKIFDDATEYASAENSEAIVYNQDDESIETFGEDDVEYEEVTTERREGSSINYTANDLNTLRKNFYIVDKKTNITEDLFNVSEFEGANLKIKKEDKPKILVFHTHSHEMFADSNTSDINEGIVGAGERLCQRLEGKYGIKCIHDTGRYDVVNGKTQILGAYERMEPSIKSILNENPSIEVVIDMHRDGVNENTRLVTDINGKKTANIMFFNGLCRIYENGSLNDIAGLPNPNLKTNLAFSYQMFKTSKQLYPNFARKIYINAYRYSLHLKPKSLLIEVGAQTNTKEEIYNAIDLLAEVLNKVIN